MEIATPQVSLILNADDSITRASLVNESLTAELVAQGGVDSLAAKLGSAMTLLNREIADKRIDVDSLQRALPRFALALKSGKIAYCPISFPPLRLLLIR